MKSVIVELIYTHYFLHLFFLRRWTEASGANSACATCESVVQSPGSSSVVTGPGKAPGSSGVGSGGQPHGIKLPGPSSFVTGPGTASGPSGGVQTPHVYPGRKSRDVSNSESMLYPKYLISYKANITVNILQCFIIGDVILPLSKC